MEHIKCDAKRRNDKKVNNVIRTPIIIDESSHTHTQTHTSSMRNPSCDKCTTNNKNQIR